jgi:hypothetical protein
MRREKPNAELLDVIEDFLRTIVAGLEDETGRRQGRPRVLPALALWAGLLVCVARGFSSQLELWRLLTHTGLWDFPRFSLKDDGVYKRLKQASGDTLHRIFEVVTEVLLAQRNQIRAGVTEGVGLADWASGVFALDEMTLDAVKKRLPSLRQTAEAVLPGKVTALFDVRAQLWRQVLFHDDARQNEKVAARDMLAYVPPGSLLLADLGYFAFAWFDDLTRLGYFWISRMRAKTSYTVLHVLYQADGVLDAIVWLGAHRADRAGQAVRLVSYTRQGKTWSYLTNVLDPARLPILLIGQLYARRWDIEMMFNMIKTHLHLHVLWSSHLAVVLHQVFAVFTVAQIILSLRTEIAQQANADVFEVSLDLLIRWLPRFAQYGEDPVRALVERGRGMLIIRPSSRLVVHAPHPTLDLYAPLPADIVLTRKPRYAMKA